MDLSRTVCSRDLYSMAMRTLDAGASVAEIARKYQLSPKLLERCRGEWQSCGEATFPGIEHRAASLPALDDQMTMENAHHATAAVRKYRYRGETRPIPWRSGTRRPARTRSVVRFPARPAATVD